PDVDCDTGGATGRGEYVLTDETYRQLLDLLLKQGLEGVQPELTANILAFYAMPSPPEARGRFRKRRHFRVPLPVELTALKAGPRSHLVREVQARLLAPPFKLQSPKASGA
ncbi:MAG TPA: hypothetical protein VHI52_07410, partial [Verrucomicrobiae bacterium]|nr:hypothetical protein [Verrucomicrobiae bacterium]